MQFSFFFWVKKSDILSILLNWFADALPHVSIFRMLNFVFSSYFSEYLFVEIWKQFYIKIFIKY